MLTTKSDGALERGTRGSRSSPVEDEDVVTAVDVAIAQYADGGA